jgi:hypothetical protein
MPFRDGAAAIALLAAKKSPRPIHALPCAIRFRYLDDPVPSLHKVMERLEDRVFLGPRPDLPLMERVLRVARVMLAIKEIEHLGRPNGGDLRQRLTRLAEAILSRVAGSLGIATMEGSILERVKELRRKTIQIIEQPDIAPDESTRRRQDLDDLFLVVQLYSYPGDYLVEQPSTERLAETIDKLEEDVLEAALPTVHGRRAVTIQFGDPLLIQRDPSSRNQTRDLTSTLETRVQELLKKLSGSPPPPPAFGDGTI